jgi:hypothetical protein
MQADIAEPRHPTHALRIGKSALRPCRLFARPASAFEGSTKLPTKFPTKTSPNYFRAMRP